MKSWSAILSELEGQMTKATFNTHLLNSRAKLEGDVLTVSLRNEYAVDWVSERLADTVERTASAVEGRPLTVKYCIFSPNEEMPARKPRAAEPLGTYVPGVNLEDKHFLKCPLFFARVVGPQGTGAEVKVYLQTLLHTVGHYDERERTYGREWWPSLTIAFLAEVAGISRNTALPAVLGGKEKGWLKWQPVGEKPFRFNLALRVEGEPVDWVEGVDYQ
jgi:hypothetical protein